MQVQLTASISSGVLYGDGVQQENISKLNGIALVVDVNKINIEDRSAILGNKYENGVIHERAGDEAPYIAVGYKVEQTNKKVELDVYKRQGFANCVRRKIYMSCTLATIHGTLMITCCVSFRWNLGKSL